MAHRVCPWWIGYCLACPLRRWQQDPQKILSPYVQEGMTVLEPGPGMGFFTLELARLVGPSGRVIAVDIQAQMIERLKHRAAKAALLDRIDARMVPPDSINSAEFPAVDFILAFAVVHELPSATRFFTEAAAVAKPTASLLLAEPKGHVKEPEFAAELAAASTAGFHIASRPSIRGSRAVLLTKK